MKLISWNVNGFRAVLKKGFEDFFEKENPDIIGLQEIKLSEGQVDFNPSGYYCYWNYAQKKGYSGTAIFTKFEPITVNYGIGIEEHDNEGRVITLEYENFFFVTVYTPNSKSELERLDYRMVWENEFLNYLNMLKEHKNVIVCGDLNVAHTEIDLKNPKTNTRSAGFTIEERNKFSALLDNGYIDTYRYLYPEKIEYSWWSYRGRARERNTGWRIDYFVVNEDLKDSVNDAKILTEVLGSDHCPVVLDIEI
ncbi:exodeoxyribonuclease III [Oceanivirga salmonicida]|uniref:exodeoxyribonuclease III n=1 Tax=Oceanivirga salmonicida TaxID=1769291 RepID=UPI00082F9E82|nr:exodeoxyribonuclease III [Oceanivirga salmonicida]